MVPFCLVGADATAFSYEVSLRLASFEDTARTSPVGCSSVTEALGISLALVTAFAVRGAITDHDMSLRAQI